MSALLHPLCSVGAQRHRHRAHPVGRRVGRQSDRRIVADARYRQDDGSALSTIADDAADWITAGLSLNNISDLDSAIGSMRRALKPDGTLLLTVPHPCFEAPRSGSVSTGGTPRRTIGDYFAGGIWRTTDSHSAGGAGNYHRTITTYVTALRNHGFARKILSDREERAPQPEFAVWLAQHRSAG